MSRCRPHLEVGLLFLCAAMHACHGTDPADVRDDGFDAADTATVNDAPAEACTADAAQLYPAGPYDRGITSTFPDLRFADASGHPFSMHDLYAPCTSPAPLVLVRVLAAWSGPSRFEASHTSRLRSLPDGGRLHIVDVLVLGAENTPATVPDLASWRALYDSPPDTLVVDPAYQIPPDTYGAPEPPSYVLIDPCTMTVVDAATFLLEYDLPNRIAAQVAALDGRPHPRQVPPTMFDNGRFTPTQWALIQEMTPPAAPPHDTTDAYADDPAAVRLGTELFTDRDLSPSGTTACSTCHDPNQAFVDHRATAMGVGLGGRNTPTVVLSGWARWQFRDGRADTLWSQALGPIENPIEMGSSRLHVAHRIAAQYAADYVAVFGPLPVLSDTTRFPMDGHPGDPAWEAMAPSDQLAVNTVFVNVGKAFEAYERTLTPAASAFDRYLAGQQDALSTDARDGLKDFVNFGCVECHYGPRLTDDSFHNVGMPTGMAGGVPDRGRIDAIAQLLSSPFNAAGAFSDDPTAGQQLTTLVADPSMLGAFHTPSLRNVGATGPWGHGGTFTSLHDVVIHYAQRATQPPSATSIGPEDRHLVGFDDRSDANISPLVAWLQSL